MRLKTTAFMVLLIFTASAFTVTLTLSELVNESPLVSGSPPVCLVIDDFGRRPFLCGDGCGGGPGGGGD